MQVTVTPRGGVKIEFDRQDGYDFAHRPNQAWPGSELSDSRPDNKMLEIDDEGDLVDSGNIPEDTSAAEVGAFIEYALEQARDSLTEQLTTSQFRNSWPRYYEAAR